jgi:ABC-2 type transport system ATP-binding protein
MHKRNTPAIFVENVSKTFRVHRKQPGLQGSIRSLFRRQWETKTALDNVSFSIENGEIVGLVGANGAGKTTLMKILSGIIYADRGRISVLGYDPWERKNAFRSRIALIMGQKAQLWWDLPAADCFLLLREIYQIPRAEFNRRLDTLAARLDVAGQLSIQIRRLSLGERMKMEIIASLLHNPSVIFLDEPTIGLDLTSQRAIRSFLTEYRDAHQPAVIITSHYMEDIKSLCRRIIILRKGAIVYDGALGHIVADHIRHKVVVARFAEAVDVATVVAGLPAGLGDIIGRENHTIRLETPREKAAEAAQFLVQCAEVADLSIEEEDISSIIESIQRNG